MIQVTQTISKTFKELQDVYSQSKRQEIENLTLKLDLICQTVMKNSHSIFSSLISYKRFQSK